MFRTSVIIYSIITVVAIYCVIDVYSMQRDQKVQDIPLIDGYQVSLSRFPTVIRLQNIFVHDGDTLKADLIFPCGLAVLNKSIRGSGWDAPEVTRTRNTGVFKTMTEFQWKEEIDKGLKAKAALSQLLGVDSTGKASNPVYVLIRDDEAAYTRLECDIWVEVTPKQDGKLKDKSSSKMTRYNIRSWMFSNGYDRDNWGVVSTK